ncbi:MAG: arginine deiminase-related protein [Nitrosomonas sp.]|nr:arginine deiminase-related protein [Nitrosomonas sp.]
MKSRFFMCPPDYFGVEYNINPWMTNNLGRVDAKLAKQQWHNLFETLSQYAKIEQIEPQPQLPDMVFTANAGLVKGNSFIPSHFRHPERCPEETHFRAWFSSKGYHLVALASDICFEGEGDALRQPDSNRLWMGYGFRTDPEAQDLLNILFPQCTSLKLVDPRFYHLDTCFCLLPGGQVMYYPGAFSQDSRQTIEAHFATKDRIEVDEENALYFVCNAIVADNNLILNHASPSLISTLAALGYRTTLTPVSEFLKAGGGTKCLALCL